MVFQWRVPTVNIPANIAGEEMLRIEQKYGEINPKLILEESREKESVLHNCFEWRDNVAAERYRVQQAGNIIRNLTVTVEQKERKNHKPIAIHAFVNVSEKQNERGSFINVFAAITHDDKRKNVLMHALKELHQFRKKYQEIQQFADLFLKIDETLSLFGEGENENTKTA